MLAWGALAVIALLGPGGGGEPVVYYGSKENPQNPARITASRVFERIPEYQEIRRRGLNENDPEYWILLDRANQKFYRAVRTVARERRRDCIAEQGTVPDDWPDDTEAVIAALE
jgi:hypothetical protein